MSLILRKEAQEILDENGLGNYFAGIDGNRRFTLNNECGSETFAVTGVTFSRANPTKSEIEYACELLRDFFRKNGTQIKEFVVELDILNSMPEPVTNDRYSSICDKKLGTAFWFSKHYNDEKWGVYYYDGGIIIAHDYNAKGELRSWISNFATSENYGKGERLKHNSSSRLEVEALAKWKPTPSLKKKALEHLAKHQAWHDQKKKCSDLRSELNSCRVFV